MRTKIIAGNLAAVLLVGLVSYILVAERVESAFLAEVDTEITGDHELLDQQWRLSSYELVQQAAEQAAEGDTRDIFTALDDERKRTRAFDRANAIADWFLRRNRNGAGAPEIVVVTDDRGVVIARNQDRNRMYEDDLKAQITTLAPALASGDPQADVWRFSSGQDKLLQAAIAPIRDVGGAVIGAVIVGYDMSNGMATRIAEVLGRDVAFFVDDAVYSSSLPGDRMQALRERLFSDALRASTEAALSPAATTSDRYLTEVGGDQYVGVTGPLSLARSTPVGYVVLGNRSVQAAKASPANIILIMTAIGFLAVVVYGFLIARLFLRPIEEMEEGVLAVINGRTDVRLDIESAELGGLAYRINQLLNVFTGTPEEDDEGRVSSPPEAWASEPGAPDARPSAESGGDEAEDPELAAQLASEPEDEYYARIYQEYVAAKEALGENVSSITQDRFVKRLQANEQSLIKKHDCRMVRFQVQTKGTQVNLRPVVIR